MFLPYSWHLFLHILGVVLFLGNIVVTAVWMILSERTKEPKVLEFSSRAVNWADVGFTAPGIILIVLNGVTLAVRWNGPLGTGWLMAAGALFLGSGIVWVGFLIRYQNKMIRLSSSPERLEGGEGGGELPSEFFRVLHKWYFWGAVATILPIAASIFMVVKPPI